MDAAFATIAKCLFGKVSHLGLICIATIFLFTASSVFATEKIVETEGSSPISRADAIRQAQRAAVEQTVGVFIHSETEISNFVLKKEEILSRSQGYVIDYAVLKEQKKYEAFTIRIRATVSMDSIKNDLIAMKILLESLKRPKLMVLIEEDYIDMTRPQMRIAETETNALLAAKGFELVDQAQLKRIEAQNQARQALAGNIAAASRLGLLFGAQYVIVGKAVTQDVGEAFAGTGLRSLQSSIQLKVVQSQSGLVLGSVVKNGVAAHISPITGATQSLKGAVKKACDEYLIDTITTSFQDYLNNGTPVKLYVTGVSSFRQYKRIAAAVESIEPVVSSKKEGWNKAGGLLILDLRFKGTSDELAEHLDGQTLGDHLLEVVDLAPDRVDCQLN